MWAAVAGLWPDWPYPIAALERPAPRRLVVTTPECPRQSHGRVTRPISVRRRGRAEPAHGRPRRRREATGTQPLPGADRAPEALMNREDHPEWLSWVVCGHGGWLPSIGPTTGRAMWKDPAPVLPSHCGSVLAWHDVLTPPRSPGIRASCWPWPSAPSTP